MNIEKDHTLMSCLFVGMMFLALGFEKKDNSQAKRCDSCPHILRKRCFTAMATTTTADFKRVQPINVL